MELVQLQENTKEMESTRQHPRYPVSLKVIFETGASLTTQKSRQEKADGDTQNLSNGGLCLITDRALKASQIIRLKLPMPNISVTMPTLAEVRWVKRESIKPLTSAQSGGSRRYIAGLRFLF